jgi:hypothetical protein
MADIYEDEVRGKTAEQILSNYHSADSNHSRYLQIAAQVRSNQELINSLKQASADTVETSRKIVCLTFALVAAAILQALATSWGYLSWWVTHGFSVCR